MTFKRGNLENQVTKVPKTLKWCKKCVMSNQRPRISFDEDGVCSACNFYKFKFKVDWEKRDKELNILLDNHRSKNGEWDVIVPSSGGKDSAYVAHQLKFKYNMNPLLVTWSPLKYTDIGFQNYNSLNDSGFTCIKANPNGLLQRKLARLCLEELGDAFHVFVLGQMFFPLHMALKFNIKLIFYGENGEPEYAGDPAIADKPYLDLIEDKKWTKDYLKGSGLNELIEYGIKNKDYLSEKDITNADLSFYNPPSEKEMINKDIRRHYYYSYYKNWDPQENFYYAVENSGFSPNPTRNEGTFSKYASLDDKLDGLHFYLRYIKFGLGRCSEDVAHEIREGHLTREEGLALMKKYEGEFPEKYFQECLEYLDITKDHFWDIVDSWRPEHLWKKKGNKWEIINNL